MHHAPGGPPLSERLTAAFSRCWFVLRRSLRLRIAPAVLVCGVVPAVVLAIPSLTPAVTDADPAVGLDSSARATPGNPPADRSERSGVVQLGVDGAGTPSEVTRTTPDTETTSSAPEGAVEPSVTDPAAEPSSEPSSEPSGPSPSVPAGTEGTTAPSSSSAAATRPPLPAPAPSPTETDAEAQVLTLVNQERAVAGCGPVAADERLAAVARAFSADMRDREFFSHTDPDGRTPSDRGDRAGVTVLAENIAQGQPDAAAVMTQWMRSDGHRANILDCSYSKLGVGVAYGPRGPWWTQDFA